MTKCSSCGTNFGKYNHHFQSGICPECTRNHRFLSRLEKIFDSFCEKIKEMNKNEKEK